MLDIFNNDADLRSLFREMIVLRSLNHSNIISLSDVYVASDDGVVNERINNLDSLVDIYLVFPYMASDLKKMLSSGGSSIVGDDIKSITSQILSGLHYLHSAGVIHRDLKPANILVNKIGYPQIKICDFGLSRVVAEDRTGITDIIHPNEVDRFDEEGDGMGVFDFPHQETHMNPPTNVFARVPLRRQYSTHVITRHYRPPEVILLQPYLYAVDLWSVGCILAELLNTVHFRSKGPYFGGER